MLKAESLNAPESFYPPRLPLVLTEKLFPEDASRILRARVCRSCVLSVGEDSDLLKTRELLLQSRGYGVLSADSSISVNPEVLSPFDLLIVCHTLGADTLSFVKAVRSAGSEILVLLLRPLHGIPKIESAGSILPSPALLISTVAQMIGPAIPHENIQDPGKMPSSHGGDALIPLSCR